MQVIQAKEAHEACQSGAVLVDVRTKPEYREVRAAGAVWHPLENIEKDAGSVATELAGKRCVLLCKTGSRASKAAELLNAHLPDGVAVVEGGTDAWVEAQLPHERDSGVISLERQVRIAVGALVATGSVLALTVSPGFAALPLFFGCGLVFAGITNWCGLAMIISKMPWNR